MLNEFKQFIAEYNLIKSSDKILLTVSGGIDSMVMTHLFLQLSNKIGIAHCNFSLRGGESDKDEELVLRYASDNKIPFYTKRFNTKIFAKENGLSIQMAARELRYNWFEEIRNDNNYDTIAVAHNLNDNIETLLINLTRGTGIAGLTGMRPANNRIIRPLLFTSRNNITNYCQQQNIIFREDKSNADTKYIRNRIRHLIIPVLKDINPSIESTLNETAERFTGINEIVTGYISELRERVSAQKGNYITININLLKAYLHNKTVLFELFRPFNITNLQLNDLIKVINGKTGGQIFTGTHRLIKNRKEILISNETNKEEQKYTIKTIKELIQIPGIISVDVIDVSDKYVITNDLSVACIDYNKIQFPLIIRKWKAGDHFYPLGMDKKKKLSDYFIDKKYSILKKEDQLILESDKKIVWIMGERIDNRFRISESTNKALIIKSGIL
jgi:tRNA(Ile)-lysidine synthase